MKNLLFLLALLPSAALAQTFTATPVSGRVPFSTSLTWNVPGATSCTATGDWTGSKPISATETIAPTATGSYVLTCAVAGPAASGSAILTWTAPTQNTDGSSLTNLAGFRVYQGAVATTLAQIQQIATPTTKTFTVPGLAPGSHFFAVSAYNLLGGESDKSAVGTKVIPNTPSSSTWTGSVSVVVLPPAKPAAPTGFTVQ